MTAATNRGICEKVQNNSRVVDSKKKKKKSNIFLNLHHMHIAPRKQAYTGRKL